MSDGVVVRGGAGGTAATLEHLRDGARLLAAAADHLDDAAASAGWAERHGLAPSPGAGPAVTRARAHTVLAPMVHGPRPLPAHADDVRRLAAALGRATDAYAAAEDAAGDVVRVLLAVVGHHAGERPVVAVTVGAVLGRAALPAVLLGVAGAHATGHGARTALGVRRLAASDPGEPAVQALAGFVRGLAPGAGPPSAVPAVGASRLVTSGTGLAARGVPALGRRPLRVTARLGASGGHPAAPRTAADVLVRVGALYPRAGGAAGTVGVDRLDHPDGTRSWVVAIPGTQAATSFGAGVNPMDMATNVRLMAAVADDGTELVTRALDAAGARPGEPVLLAGHSQGGLVAVALAGNAAFTARHRVAAVLTAGSPVATCAVPRGTAALHLEHRQDLVPALDGWRNPDAPNRTTAVRDLSVSPSAVDRLASRSPGAAHGVDAYARTARAVADVGGPSVGAWERAAGDVLGGPGVVVTRHEFTGERHPLLPEGRVLAPGPDPGPDPGPGSVPGSSRAAPAVNGPGSPR